MQQEDERSLPARHMRSSVHWHGRVSCGASVLDRHIIPRGLVMSMSAFQTCYAGRAWYESKGSRASLGAPTGPKVSIRADRSDSIGLALPRRSGGVKI